MNASKRIGWLALGLALGAMLQSAGAFAAAPGFRVVELGSGSPIDVNAAGTVVGIRGTSSVPLPWVVAGGVRSDLPLPAGATYAMVNRVSEGGVAAGHVSGTPLLWVPGVPGYTSQWVPLPAGASACEPSGVRDTAMGPQVLLNCGVPGLFSSPTRIYFATSAPYLYSAAEGLVDLRARYALSWASVSDMTASGRILTSSGAILEPDGTVTPAPPPRVAGYWTGWGATRLNEAGAMVAIASLATSDGHAEIARYSPATGWFVIETFIGAMYPYSADGISEAGDAISSQYGGHMLTTADGQRLPLGGLLLDPGYALTSGPGGAIADDGRIVSVARNPAGVWTAVRLDPAGPFPPPAPVVLSGAAHPATASAPWDAISLAWTASSGASGYLVERKGPNDPGFFALTPTGGTIQLKYDDTSIAPLTLYTYRVIATGVGGNGAPSNEVTVLSPPPKDSVPPLARITSPASGAVVGGPITVSAEASDNVGLRGFEIRYQPNQGSDVLCARSYASAKPADTLSCTWDPRYLPSGSSAQLIAYAYDDLGNWVSAPISVTYQNSAPDTTAPKVSVQEPANNATVSGTVMVRASAKDNVGVVRMEIRDAGGKVLASADGAAISHAWNTSGLRKGSRQSLTVRAWDAAGNAGSAKVTVRIGG